MAFIHRHKEWFKTTHKGSRVSYICPDLETICIAEFDDGYVSIIVNHVQVLDSNNEIKHVYTTTGLNMLEFIKRDHPVFETAKAAQTYVEACFSYGHVPAEHLPQVPGCKLMQDADTLCNRAGEA